LKETEEESLQDLESHVFGQLLSTASQDSEDTEEEWRRKKSGHSDGQRRLHLTTVWIWDGQRSAIRFIRFEGSAFKYSRSGA
jgi:hypothetical protein